VLFVSAVYFPRVTGVSTSIRTFRQDLASLGVDTCLVAPSYAAPDAPSEEPGVLRVPATKVPRDPEDRRMGWRALTRALDALPGGRFDLVHIHTPFIAHYAGVRLARRADIPAIATYDLSHLLRGVSASLHAAGAGTAREIPGAQLQPLAVRGGARADRPFRADARGADRLWGHDSDPRGADGTRGGSLPPGRRPRLPRPRRHRRRAGARHLHRSGRAREEHRLPAADVPRGDPLGAGSAARDRGRRSGARGPAAA